MGIRVGVVNFPGSWSETDFVHAFGRLPSAEPELIWHTRTSLAGIDVVILPGGFSYGDHLRAGAIAARSPLMAAVVEFANAGGTVLGSCNGFQVLCEAGLLPGLLRRNASTRYRCDWVHLKVDGRPTRFTSGAPEGSLLRLPISHGEGSYQADERTIAELEGEGRVALRYASPAGAADRAHNPNGSINNIAGIVNPGGNVLGLMPHPERACEKLLGGADGNVLLESVLRFAAGAA